MGVCRCGCGNKLPMGAGRASGRACYVASFLPGLMHLQECLDSSGTDTESLDAFTREGRAMFKNLLQACHGGDDQYMPSSRELGDWESQALRLCQQLAKVDPQWFRAWSGPSNKGPLVESESAGTLLVEERAKHSPGIASARRTDGSTGEPDSQPAGQDRASAAPVDAVRPDRGAPGAGPGVRSAQRRKAMTSIAALRCSKTYAVRADTC